MLPLGLYGLNKCAQHLFRIGALFRSGRRIFRLAVKSPPLLGIMRRRKART